MNDHELRTFTKIEKFFPRRIARALKRLVSEIPPDAFGGALVALCIWEPNDPVSLSSIRLYAVWDDTLSPGKCPCDAVLEKLARGNLASIFPSIEIEYLPLTPLVQGFADHEETIRRRLAKSIVLFDQETLVPLKALLEMTEEWEYQPFKAYLRTSILSTKPETSQELDSLFADYEQRAPDGNEWTIPCDRKAALRVIAQIAQKFESYVEAVVVTGNPAGTGLTPSSIVVIINDTDVERLQRVELKLKIQSHFHRFEVENHIQGIVSPVLLTELYDYATRNPSAANEFFCHSKLIVAKPVWERLCRVYSATTHLTPSLSTRTVLWDVTNVPLWLGKISPNVELRGYENRKVSGGWGTWQRIARFANRHELAIVVSFVWLFVITLLAYLGLTSGFASIRIALFLVGFVVLFPMFQQLIFRGLVRVGWGMYSPFIMPAVICLFWAGAFLGARAIKPDTQNDPISIERLESLRNTLSSELEQTSQNLKATFKRLEEADAAQHEAIQKQIGQLTIHKDQLEKDIGTLSTVRGEQADTLGRLYVEQMRKEFEQQNGAQQRWDIMINGIFLILGALVGQLIRLGTHWIAAKRKQPKPLTV